MTPGKLLALLLFSLFWFTPVQADLAPAMPLQGSGSPAQAVYRVALPSTLLLRQYRPGKSGSDWQSKGTGFVAAVGGRHVILSVAHVVAVQGCRLEALDSTGRTHRVSGVAWCKTCDIGVAMADGLDALPALPLASVNADVASDAYLLGFPERHCNAVFLPGVVSQYDQQGDDWDALRRPVMGVSQTILPGDSGAPVLNANGFVVGVAVMTEYHEFAPTLSYAVPAESIVAVLPGLVAQLK